MQATHDWPEIRSSIRKAHATLNEWERLIAAAKSGVDLPEGFEALFGKGFNK